MYRLLLIFIILPTVSFAQNTLGTQSQGIDFDNYAFGSIDQFDERQSKLKGSPYLFEKFDDLIVVTDSKDTILFEDSNFNLSSMNLEFKKDDGMHFFSSRYFYTFFDSKSLDNRYLIKKFSSLDKKQVEGVFKIINDNDNYSLIKYFHLKIKESNYNAVLDHGDKSDKIVINEDNYLLHEFQLIPIDRSKRKFSKYFSRKNEILSYIRNNKLSFKNEQDLSELSNFLNEKEFEVNL